MPGWPELEGRGSVEREHRSEEHERRMHGNISLSIISGMNPTITVFAYIYSDLGGIDSNDICIYRFLTN